MTYAHAHTLDDQGTTIPDEHLECIQLGAEAFFITPYLTQVNDNFEWVDGEYRDRVDDTKSILAWRTMELTLTARFEQLLTGIEQRDTDTIDPIARWCDKPYYWDRL